MTKKLTQQNILSVRCRKIILYKSTARFLTLNIYLNRIQWPEKNAFLNKKSYIWTSPVRISELSPLSQPELKRQAANLREKLVLFPNWYFTN